MKKLQSIVLTGGPCASKSTALPMVRDLLVELGYRVAVVPEVAGLLLGNGFRLREAASSDDVYAELQAEICRVQLALEDAQRLSLELTPGPGVVLCDRGLIDSKAYVPPDMWQRVVGQFSRRAEERWLERYDRVYHLVSAADGAEDHYESAGVRTESVDVALTLEELTYDAWGQHPRRREVDNSHGSFQGKLEALLGAVREDFQR